MQIFVKTLTWADLREDIDAGQTITLDTEASDTIDGVKVERPPLFSTIYIYIYIYIYISIERDIPCYSYGSLARAFYM